MPITYENPYGGRKYLQDNFSHIDPESRFMMRFFHDAYRQLPTRKRLVEIGGGGALYSLISARTKVDEIVYGEFNSWCREDIERWRNAEDSAHDWGVFFEETRKLEGHEHSAETMSAQLRQKLSAVIECNIFAPQCGIDDKHGKQFDIVSSQFCAESISSTLEQTPPNTPNTLSLVAPDGYLVISLLHNAKYWDFADDKVFCALVDREGVMTLLENNGFEILMHRHSQEESQNGEGEEFCAEAANGHNYDGLLCITAKRK